MLPVAEVKAKFSEMFDRVEHTHERITVTGNGRRAEVLDHPEELDSLEGTLELLSDPAALAQLHESRRALAAGTSWAPTNCAPATWRGEQRRPRALSAPNHGLAERQLA